MKLLLVIPLLLLYCFSFGQEEENDWEKQFIDSILAVPVKKYVGIQAGGGAGLKEKGMVVGFGLNYLANKTEIGFAFLSQSKTKKTDAGGGTKFSEKKKITAFSILVNQLIGYNQHEKKLFAIVGLGIGSVDQEWSYEKSENGIVVNPLEDIEKDKTPGAGSIINVGIGKSISRSFDIRLEFPTIVPFSTSDRFSSYAPNIMVSIGYRM